MKITRRDLATATTSSLPFLIALGVVSGRTHGDPWLRVLVLVTVLAAPFLGIRLLLALPSDLRVTRRSMPVYALFVGLAASWSYAVKVLADLRAIPVDGRFAFALQIIAGLGVFMAVLIGSNLWLQSRIDRAGKGDATGRK